MTQIHPAPVSQKRRKLTTKQRVAIWDQQDGHCGCGCGGWLDGTTEYDHILELALGGEDTVANLQALLSACHKRKTAERIKMIRKADRQRRYHETGRSSAKIKRKLIRSRGFDKTVRKKFDGTVEKV